MGYYNFIDHTVRQKPMLVIRTVLMMSCLVPRLSMTCCAITSPIPFNVPSISIITLDVLKCHDCRGIGKSSRLIDLGAAIPCSVPISMDTIVFIRGCKPTYL